MSISTKIFNQSITSIIDHSHSEEVKTLVQHQIPSLIAGFQAAKSDRDLDRMERIQQEICTWLETAQLLEGGYVNEGFLQLQELVKRDIETIKLDEKSHPFHVLSKEEVDPIVMTEFPPAGIFNAKANCWANALIQMLANAPNLAKELLNRPQMPPIAKLLLNYYSNQLLGNTFARQVDNQKLRTSIQGIEQDARYQVDAYEGLASILEKANLNYQIWQTKTSLDPLGEVQTSETIIEEPLIQLNMNYVRSFDFDALMKDAFFYQSEKEDVQLQFETAPEDLLIRVNRFGMADKGKNCQSYKINDGVKNIPQRYLLPKEFTKTKEKAQYELTGCIIHKGTDFTNGHYVALEKKAESWFLIDDETVFLWQKSQWNLIRGNKDKCPLSSPEKLLENGYIFHFGKVNEKKSTPQVKNVSQLKEELPLIKDRSQLAISQGSSSSKTESIIKPPELEQARYDLYWVASMTYSIVSGVFKILSYPISYFWGSPEKAKNA